MMSLLGIAVGWMHSDRKGQGQAGDFGTDRRRHREFFKRETSVTDVLSDVFCSEFLTLPALLVRSRP